MSKPLSAHSLEPPILVWTVGKVASSSIYATLKHYGFDALHLHYLSDWYLTHQVNKMYRGKHLPLHVVSSLRFRHALDRALFQRPIQIVTLVRDPLARNISAYFENLKLFSRDVPREAQSHVKNFVDRYPHDIALDWFDSELLDVTGTDYRRISFDPDRGWAVHRTDAYDLLVMRAEDPDDLKLEALSNFLGMEFSELIRENEAANKSYRDLYAAFRERLELPRGLVDHMYDNEFCSTFWTPTEVRRMKSAWRVTEAVMPESKKAAPNASNLGYAGVRAELPPPTIDKGDPQSGGGYTSDSARIAEVQAVWSVWAEGWDRCVKLRIAFALAEASPCIKAAVSLYAQDELLVATLAPPGPMPRTAGKHVLAAELLDAPLNPGVYQAVLTISAGDEVLHRMRIDDLIVEGDPTAAQQPGVVSIPQSWRWSG